MAVNKWNLNVVKTFFFLLHIIVHIMAENNHVFSNSNMADVDFKYGIATLWQYQKLPSAT